MTLGDSHKRAATMEELLEWQARITTELNHMQTRYLEAKSSLSIAEAGLKALERSLKSCNACIAATSYIMDAR